MSEETRDQPAPKSPIARLIGVLVSPTETFKDVARKPGWLAPFACYLAVFCVAFGIYAMKADWVGIVTDQIENSPIMKIFSDQQKDQAVARATEGIKKQTQGELAATNLCNIAGGVLIFYHLLAMIYSSLFVMMGSLSGLKLGRAWLNFALCVLVFIGYLIVYGIGQFAFKDSPQSMLLIVVPATIVMLAGWGWLLNRHAQKDEEFHKMLSVCMYAASAVGIVGSIVLAAVSLAQPGTIQVAVDAVVKSNLGALLKPENAVLKSLFGSLELFWVWFLIVLAIGYREVTRLSMGTAASITFLPWGLIVMIKIAWAAVFG